MGNNLNEPVCWNCRKAIRLSAGTFETCLSYDDNLPCEYVPEINEEGKYPHKSIFCPNLGYAKVECSGCYPMEMTSNFSPCEDCPIDWSKLRIIFDFKETKNGYNCPDCGDEY